MKEVRPWNIDPKTPKTAHNFRLVVAILLDVTISSSERTLVFMFTHIEEQNNNLVGNLEVEADLRFDPESFG